MPDANYARPDLTTFCRLDDLGLEVVGQQLQPAGRCCRAGWPSLIGGAGGVAAKASRATA